MFAVMWNVVLLMEKIVDARDLISLWISGSGVKSFVYHNAITLFFVKSIVLLLVFVFGDFETFVPMNGSWLSARLYCPDNSWVQYATI